MHVYTCSKDSPHYLEGSLHRKTVRGNTVANPLLSLSSVPVQSANQGWKNSETNKQTCTDHG